MDTPETPAQFSITGTVRSEDCALTTLGNWTPQGKGTLDAAKLTIALRAPDNALLANAFHQNVKTIEGLEKSALQLFSKSSSVANQSSQKTSPNKRGPPCSETYYSVRSGKSSKLNGPHFRHKIFIKV